MTGKLQSLLAEIRELEQSVAKEIQTEQKHFAYTVRKKKVVFEKEIQKQQRRLRKGTLQFLAESSPIVMLTAPVIYSLLVPAAFMDLFISTYQLLCFPIYRIQKVQRREYIIFDRKQLKYLNWIERMNCMYCSYFNGLIAYVREVAARTEQYWCPIRHAFHAKGTHTRYGEFLPYGDSTDYHKRLEVLRKKLVVLP